jgi:malonyl-CoA O-methyltransferase
VKEDRPVLDRRALQRGFDRAAAGYDTGAVLEREVAGRMAARLQYVKLAPARLLDLGCGTGADFELLRLRYPDALPLGCDLSAAMLLEARRRRPWIKRALPLLDRRRPGLVCADAIRLPLATGSVALVWSNQMLHWLDDPLPALREMHRVLEVGGLLMFSTLGPDTLKELRHAFAGVDSAPHVHGFIDMHDLGDMLVASGFAEPVMDMEFITLTYEDLSQLAHDLRRTGATSRILERRRGLMGRGLWQSVQRGYDSLQGGGRLPATFEVIYGHGWKAPPRRTDDGRAIVRLDLPRRAGMPRNP